MPIYYCPNISEQARTNSLSRNSLSRSRRIPSENHFNDKRRRSPREFRICFSIVSVSATFMNILILIAYKTYIRLIYIMLYMCVLWRVNRRNWLFMYIMISILGMNIFVAFFVLLLLLADNTPPAASAIPLIGKKQPDNTARPRSIYQIMKIIIRSKTQKELLGLRKIFCVLQCLSQSPFGYILVVLPVFLKFLFSFRSSRRTSSNFRVL